MISLGPGEGGAADGVESHGEAGQELVKCLRVPAPFSCSRAGSRIRGQSAVRVSSLDPIRCAVAFPRACTLGSWDAFPGKGSIEV